jgi:predicted alpha/beta-hydrolase family hydrolase
VVVFAHGSGRSRHSPRNRRVAAALQRAGYGTVLMDLLTTGTPVRRVPVPPRPGERPVRPDRGQKRVMRGNVSVIRER